MPKRLFIHATNVHQGGGRSLLEPLLNTLHVNIEFVLSLDERMPSPIGLADNIKIKRVKPSVMQRLHAERWLEQSVTAEDVVLCFGNLPPLFKLRAHTVVFMQNRYLIDNVKLKGFPFWSMLRLGLERMWLLLRMSNANEFIVQTPTMKRLLERKTRGRVPVHVLPFVAVPDCYARSVPQSTAQKNKHFDFVYVASGETHKNCQRLMEAWCLLAEEGLFPSLCLTINETRFAEECRKIEMISQRFGLKVKNAGELSRQDVLGLYRKSGALIYPSIFESCGLPLIEARQAGLPVLAAELDYVRDVLDPEQTFDPESPVSIARAVKRFLGGVEQPLPLLDARSFLQRVIG